MNNNQLLYIIENENFSPSVSDGTFTGIDTTSPDFPYYMEGRINKSQVLIDELSKGDVPYEYLEVIATSQLNEIESGDLISKIKNNDLSKDEIFKYVETSQADRIKQEELESDNNKNSENEKIKHNTIAREELINLVAQTDMRDTDIITDLDSDEKQKINNEETELIR